MCSNGWKTTSSYTFRPPHLVPGYTGYIPQQRYGYGDTFGCVTAQCFHSQRTEQLFNKTDQVARKYFASGTPKSFPTTHSNNPESVLANRKQDREKLLANQKYSRTIEGTREEQLNNYLQSCQKHREHYADQSGTVQRVNLFILPKLTHNYKPPGKRPISRNEVMPPNNPKFVYNHHAHHHDNRRASVRDRGIRDQFFENR
ncbi:ciliary microtubule inner protein 2C-like [Clytia hemisphaerica]|uniref:Ciliary microtubule inner protein 2C n=1 Tax=Clytia hemisphaerica TaxID=252671 RepID=A0A7M5WU83_9CNID